MCLGQLAASYKFAVLAHLSGIVPSRSKSAKEIVEKNGNQLKLAVFKYKLKNYKTAAQLLGPPQQKESNLKFEIEICPNRFTTLVTSATVCKVRKI